MKKAFLSCAVGVFFNVAAAFAAEEASVLLFPNGDVEIENVGAASAAPRTIVELGTNADCRVVCQVYYTDNANPLPTEIEQINETDRIVNVLLATYLSGECWELQADELVEEHRTGGVFERLARFPEWLTMTVAALRDSEELARLDLTVVAVSMRAVGELGRRVAE